MPTKLQTILRTLVLFTLLMSLMLLIALFSSALPAYAQSCNPVIAELNQGISRCSEINSNWVCYASTEAEAKPIQYRFFEPQDRRPFPVLQEVNMLDNQGTVLMNLQLKGNAAPLKVILFGKVDLQNSDPAQNMLTLSFKNGQYLCEATPPGMLVQTAEGETGFVTVNGVDIALGSTAYVTQQAAGQMSIVNLEGQVQVTLGGVTQVLPVGQQTLIAFTNGQPAFIGQPSASPLFTSTVAQWLVRVGLPRVHNTNTTALNCVGEINFGETITTQNIDAGQECLYHFCAKAGDAVTVQMDAIDPALNPWVDLRGPGGWLVAFNDDIKGSDRNSLLCNRVLPLTSCDYTIVARSAHNASKGQFKLTLNHQTSCTQPELRCRVVALRGVGLRQAPNADAAIIQYLPANAQLQPDERSTDGAWAHVKVVGTGQQGWVNQIAGAIECEDDGNLTPAVTATPTPAPDTGEESKHEPVDCKNKCSPFEDP